MSIDWDKGGTLREMFNIKTVGSWLPGLFTTLNK